MSKNYLIDYNFGIESENNIIHALQTHFNDDSIIKLNKCHTFDFKGNNKYIELKTRRNNYLKYPTTLIGLNKCISINIKSLFQFFTFWDSL